MHHKGLNYLSWKQVTFICDISSASSYSKTVTTHTGSMHKSISVIGLQSTVNSAQVQGKPKHGATFCLEVAKSDRCPFAEHDREHHCWPVKTVDLGAFMPPTHAVTGRSTDVTVVTGSNPRWWEIECRGQQLLYDGSIWPGFQQYREAN